MSLYLGFDSSTQSLSAVAIDITSGQVVLDESINFGEELPQYDSPNGFLDHANPLVKQSNPLMWVAALELLLTRMQAADFPFSEVAAVSGSGQQHGSVYLNQQFAKAASWQGDRSLVEQIEPCLSRAVSPIWMDSSTTPQCRAIADAVGGDDYLVRSTGSKAIERFTGPQIGKFASDEPSAYAATDRIHLVSSFMASVLVGGHVPIDHGDGAGMNLMNLASGDWDEKLLAATADGLAAKLPPLVASGETVGNVAPYFCDKYGFADGTPLIAWSGDNPNSLVGMGAIKPGTAVISLGTSDTYFAAMGKPLTDPNGFGHVFGNPAGGFMCLIAFKNGSLAREEVRDRFGMDWDAFGDAILNETEAGNSGNLMLPYYVPEITPLLLNPEVRLLGDDAFTAWENGAAAARAVVEAQAISMRLHSQWIGEEPERILVTGGGSQSQGIMQVLADVFGAKLERLAGTTNSAALGAALRAAHAAGADEWDALLAQFATTDSTSQVSPNMSTAPIYDALAKRYSEALTELA